MNKVAVIVLAAGLGTRMKSNKAKVLHQLGGQHMILYVIEAASKVAGENVIVVVGHQAEKVKNVISAKYNVKYAMQTRQLGTGHAVLCAMDSIPETADDVIILCGDVPLLSAKTINQLFENHLETRRDISVLTVELDDPSGYGRIIIENDQKITAIIEESDASEKQKEIRLINSGIYCVNKKYLQNVITKIKTDNAQQEFYLTDIISIGHEENRSIGSVIGKESQAVIGINTLDDLKNAENILKNREIMKTSILLN